MDPTPQKPQSSPQADAQTDRPRKTDRRPENLFASTVAKLLRHSFLRFLISGSTAALVNFLTRILLNLVFPYATSIVLAYFVGMVTAFMLYKYYVFAGRPSKRTTVEVLWFLAVNAVALIQVLFMSLFMNDHVLPALGVTWLRPEIAHTVGIATPVLSSYFGHRYFSFGGAARKGTKS